MKTIKCPNCYAEILLIPDVKAMHTAISEHLKECGGDEFILCYVDLVRQIMEAASYE